MLDKNTAKKLHQDVDAICNQILQAHQELVDISRALAELDMDLANLICLKISRKDPELGEFLTRSRYSFELVLRLDDVAITEILKRVDKKTLTVALKGCEEPIQSQFFRNMSSKAVELMKEEMEFMGLVSVKDVRKVQQEVVSLIKELDEEGVLSIEGYPGYVS